jgi:hypothetical protein
MAQRRDDFKSIVLGDYHFYSYPIVLENGKLSRKTGMPPGKGNSFQEIA